MAPIRLGSGLLSMVLLGAGLVPAQEAQGVLTVSAGSDGIGVPKKKKHVQPEYPQEALAQGIRGIVILELLIDTEGQVAAVEMIRSIAGLDEAAIAAVQQWEYEVTRVEGRPVNVRLTVPITFALRLPEISKQSGIPELRQGVTPPWPSDSGNGGHSSAEVTLDPDGRVGVARVLEGEEPWSSSLIQALRTWRFAAPPEGVVVSFRVEADFVPGSESSRRVALRLTGLRESETLASGEAAEGDETTDVAGFDPAPAGEDTAETPPLEEAPEAETSDTAADGPDEAGSPARESTPEEAAAEEAVDEATEDVARADELARPEESAGVEEPADDTGAGDDDTAPAVVARSAPPATGPEATPGPPHSPVEAEGEAAPPAEAAVPGAEPVASGEDPSSAPAPAVLDPTAPPPVEVITAAPPPLPPENGISALQGVTLEPGVPDLTRGRRPVAPPLARMAGTSGTVEVDFSVGPGGTTVIGDVRGPDILQAAARGAVESWTFLRTRADRLYLVAVFTYDADSAFASVRPQQP